MSERMNPQKLTENSYDLPKQDKMIVGGKVFLNESLMESMIAEVDHYEATKRTGMIPALCQIQNVANLPGIVGKSVGLPDMHAGYGFSIGHVAAFDMDDPKAVVSPGGVGFDINCGVRMIRTNMHYEEFKDKKEQVADLVFGKIPVGVGVSGLTVSAQELVKILDTGMKWAVDHEYAWPEDCLVTEDEGTIQSADAKCVSQKAKSRGMIQLGTLGSGNHYAEIQVVDEIYNEEAAEALQMFKGQICIMIHSGSRGLGHQVASDAVKDFADESIELPDRQLACFRINSKEGQDYLKAMAAAANYAFVNRSIMCSLVRAAFSEAFGKSARDLGMHMVYDVCHNMAKVENHVVDGVQKRLLVHRKGATRAFPPHHPNVPEQYKHIGQPVLVGGSMGTFSYVLTGTQESMNQSFGSTCHGAGRALGRNQARKVLDSATVLERLKRDGITVRVASENLINEEAPESYKDVCEVVDVCHNAGISRKAVRLRPVAVIKG